MKKIVVIVGHPNKDSFAGSVAESYKKGALKSKFKVDVIYLGELKFNLLLEKGYKEVQKMEKDLIEATRKIVEADHLVFAYPIWWGGVPAILKAFIERVFLPGVAFKYRQGNPIPERLFRGKTARLLVNMDAPVFWHKAVIGAAGERMLKKAVLEYCGVKTLGVNYFGEIRKSSIEKRERWMKEVFELGKRGI